VIRPMTEDDIPDLIRMGKRFYDESPEYKRYNFAQEKLYQLGLWALTEPDRMCLVYDKGGIQGMMYGMVYQQYFSTDLTASELFLFVDQDRRGALIGKRLVSAFEHWAHSMNAREIRVGVSAGINPDRVVGFYRALGYSLTASQLRKVL
jgi:GNAT superfamily N-acetyltransferase